MIPFKSLGYRGAGPQTWGINVRRHVKWKNESSMLSKVPASFSLGWTQMSAAGTLVGLETPEGSDDARPRVFAVGERLNPRGPAHTGTRGTTPRTPGPM